MSRLFFILVFLKVCLLQAQQKHVHLCSKTNGGIVLNSGEFVTFWGYGYYTGVAGINKITLPGPALTFDLNDSVYLHFHNLSPEGHTIHLHGLDVDMMNDGAPHTTGQVNTNDSTTYFFIPSHTGMYLYHCHVMSVHHVALGMSGMIAIRNKPDTLLLYNGGPGFNREYSYLATDFDTDWNANPVFPGAFHLFKANYFMLNGKSGPAIVEDTTMVIKALPNDSIALHLGNMGYTSTKYIFPTALNAKVVMSDGRMLPVPISTDTLQIYPGERYEVLLRPTTFHVGFITVSYHDAVLDQNLGTNLIGVNNTVFPGVIEHSRKNAMVIYPNPGHEKVFFAMDDYRGAKVVVTDITGKTVLSTILQEYQNYLDVAGFPNGTYIFSIQTSTREVCFKFVKQ